VKDTEIEAEVSSIRLQVHKDIPSLRAEAYKILEHVTRHPDRFKDWSQPAESFKDWQSQPAESKEQVVIQHVRTAEDLTKFADAAVAKARDYGDLTVRITNGTPRDVLNTTRRAGILLADTEEIMSGYNSLKEADPAILSQALSSALTVVATARDQILAADGIVKNLKEDIGRKELNYLLRLCLLPTAIIYLVFHPALNLPFSLPSEYRLIWEVLFWSLFGAISISIISIGDDVTGDKFDPRHVDKYYYRIPVTPFVSFVLLFFLSLIGVAVSPTQAGGTSSVLQLSLTEPDFPVIIVLSFLFGFFGKRSLEVLDQAWQRIFPMTRSKEDIRASSNPPNGN